MRRLARLALNGLTVLSLLLCVATAALWVRSYRVYDVLDRTEGADDVDGFRPVAYAFESRCGGLGLNVTHGDVALDGQGAAGPRWSLATMNTGPDVHPQEYPGAEDLGYRPWHGFIVARLPVGDPPTQRWELADVVVPDWFLLGVTALLPARACRAALVRRRRRRAGLCARCGYDLRATPDLCPECGTPATPATLERSRA